MDSPQQQEILARINARLSSTVLCDIVLADAIQPQRCDRALRR